MPPRDKLASYPLVEVSRPSAPGNGAPPAQPAQIAAAIRDLLANRRPGASLCPSEVARLLARKGGAWRELMPEIRAVAADLVRRGELRVTQRGRSVDPLAARGPIRLALPSAARSPEG